MHGHWNRDFRSTQGAFTHKITFCKRPKWHCSETQVCITLVAYVASCASTASVYHVAFMFKTYYAFRLGVVTAFYYTWFGEHFSIVYNVCTNKGELQLVVAMLTCLSIPYGPTLQVLFSLCRVPIPKWTDPAGSLFACCVPIPKWTDPSRYGLSPCWWCFHCTYVCIKISLRKWPDIPVIINTI